MDQWFPIVLLYRSYSSIEGERRFYPLGHRAKTHGPICLQRHDPTDGYRVRSCYRCMSVRRAQCRPSTPSFPTPTRAVSQVPHDDIAQCQYYYVWRCDGRALKPRCSTSLVGVTAPVNFIRDDREAAIGRAVSCHIYLSWRIHSPRVPSLRRSRFLQSFVLSW
jgi:hypothetical protein